MSNTQKPDALRLAEILDKYALNPLREVAAELRSQHAHIAELEAHLSAIGAGGVEPLRKREEPAAPQGWMLVPSEPTKEMIAQACKDHGYPGGSRWIYRNAYRSMLAAVPQPPEVEIGKEQP